MKQITYDKVKAIGDDDDDESNVGFYLLSWNEFVLDLDFVLEDHAWLTFTEWT